MIAMMSDDIGKVERKQSLKGDDQCQACVTN